jgi:hypothetical protein
MSQANLRLDFAILVFLAFDGFLTAVLEVLYLPLYVAGHQFPVSIVVAAVVNLALVLLVASVTSRGGFLVAPLLLWVVGLFVCAMSTPGGSVIMTSHEQGRTLVLLVVGLLPAAGYLALRRIRSPR